MRFLVAIMAMFLIRPVITYNTDCPGTELIDIFGNVFAVEDELPQGKYILLLNRNGTDAPEDDVVVWIFENKEAEK